MIDFKSKTLKQENTAPIDPNLIYKKLDLQSDKGDLRDTQKEVLKEWFSNFRDKEELIIKLHTGEGKTLVGLLILQSYLNEKKGPVLYLCPNNYLVDQTCNQARMFGFSYSIEVDKMPEAYDGDNTIYITTCQKLFNGKSKFGIEYKSKNVYAIIMDDAHQCLNVINDSFKIVITKKKNENLLNELQSLFAEELSEQGLGTFEEIKAGKRDSILQVPYWGWLNKVNEVARLLANYDDDMELRFSWNLLKDNLKDCDCIVSGDRIEIYPIISLIDKYGSYTKANRKIFMSATYNDDSFLVKTLGIKTETIKNALVDTSKTWSGEKMILIPEDINQEEGNRDTIRKWLCKSATLKYGIVSLLPSNYKAKEWEHDGALFTTKDNIYDVISNLQGVGIEQVIAISNRYDGIDLPDKACRILIIDSLPQGSSLEEELMESCLSDSDYILKKRTQTVEQGLGRAVRGPRDYSVIIILGSDLVNFIKSSKTAKYFSSQTEKQVEIGKKITGFALDDKTNTGCNITKCLVDVINQCLRRDVDWKEYYKEEMNTLIPKTNDYSMLNVFEMECKAEQFYKEKKYDKATEILQNIIDKNFTDDFQQKGWYLQKIARYLFGTDQAKSIHYQTIAHKNNSYLLSPENRQICRPKQVLDLKRVQNIKNWINRFSKNDDIRLEIADILSKLAFAVKAEKFEKAVKDIGIILGYESFRPEKEQKEGPDNLWQISNKKFLIIECKNEVIDGRQFISRDEVGQMSRSCSWFEHKYPGYEKDALMIITTNKIEEGVFFSADVKICMQNQLENFKKKIKCFIEYILKFELGTISDYEIETALKLNSLESSDLIKLLGCDLKLKKK
ncbi:DEAD/DEAH box helicase family protein [Anaerosporobacter sp.]|uniref:DEAD/DEAH box helicase family protein n=1 Tax=Anaerosporobacter sp. TaxID=1872529 RepID=UPI00286F6822|nr:DEAD/DEAH box helicase family protein [Anaerosporobacter sp.]